MSETTKQPWHEQRTGPLSRDETEILTVYCCEELEANCADADEWHVVECIRRSLVDNDALRAEVERLEGEVGVLKDIRQIMRKAKDRTERAGQSAADALSYGEWFYICSLALDGAYAPQARKDAAP